MKRILCLFLIVISMIITLTACDSQSKSKDESNIENSYTYKSYSELNAFFMTNENTKKATALDNIEIYDAEYTSLVNNIVDKKIQLSVPYFKNEQANLRDLEG